VKLSILGSNWNLNLSVTGRLKYKVSIIAKIYEVPSEILLSWGKSKSVPLLNGAEGIGRVEIELHVFLTSLLAGDQWSASFFTPGKKQKGMWCWIFLFTWRDTLYGGLYTNCCLSQQGMVVTV